MTTTISVPTTARVISGLQAYLPGFETRLNLEWDIREPYAVVFAFEQPANLTVLLHADRELLTEALGEPLSTRRPKAVTDQAFRASVLFERGQTPPTQAENVEDWIEELEKWANEGER